MEDIDGIPTYTIIIKDFVEKMKTKEYREMFLKTKEITVHGGKKFVISISSVQMVMNTLKFI